MLVVGAVIAIGGATFWIIRPTRQASPAGVSAPAGASKPVPAASIVAQRVSQPAPAPDPARAELERLREENIRLRQQMARPAPVPTFTAAPAVARPAPAPKPPPRGIAISGSAYVVRAGGQSDILRGFHVTLVQNTVPPDIFRNSLTRCVQAENRRATENRQEAVEDRKRFPGISDGKLYDDWAREAETKAAKFSQLASRITEPVDSARALKLVEQSGFVNIVKDLADSIKIASTATDVQGGYKFANAPVDSYIFGIFDTKDGFLMWAVPVKEGGPFDLFNDTAAAQN